MSSYIDASHLYDFAPFPYLGQLFNSRGVSDDSRKLEKEREAAQNIELTRASESSASRINGAIPRLSEIYATCRNADWNGRGAVSIPFMAIIEATRVLAQLPTTYPMPEIIPETTGEVGLEWYVDPYHVLLLSLAGDGYIYFSRLLGFKNTDYGSKPLAGKLHKDILELLEELYEEVKG